MLELFRSRIANMPRPIKHALMLAFDTVVLSGSVWLAYSLRLGQWHSPSSQQWLLIALAPIVSIPIFIRMGLYRAVIRYLPERSIWAMLKAVTLAALAWLVAVFVTEMAGNGIVPRSVPFLYWLVAGLLITGSRFAAQRILWYRRDDRPARGQLLIYGAGEAGSELAKALQFKGRHRIAGFLDDDKRLHGRDLAGIRIYPPSHLPNLITNFGVTEVALSIPSMENEKRQAIVDRLRQFPVKIRTLPTLEQIISGEQESSHLREIDIDDLLGRSAVPPDRALLQQIVRGRSILVTGAGGSIGAELCREIVTHDPKLLVLFEQNEFALYTIHRELVLSGKVVPILASITDPAAVAEALREHQIDVLFHAAAYKHVPLIEENVLQGVCNNVFGTLTVVQNAFDNGVRNFVLISSDKAVRPTNVMGATKQWSELVVAHFADRARAEGREQAFCSVRFGNVLGSNGSVVPLFREQIDQGGPLTVTHPDMTRYFMSIHEAAELIIQAAALSKGGDVLLLEMGQPIKIMDLARNMIRLAGQTIRDEHNPDGSIDIVITGIRPGEKMFEEMFYDESSAEVTAHPKILRAPSQEHVNILPALTKLDAALSERDIEVTKSVLFDLIGGAHPPEPKCC